MKSITEKHKHLRTALVVLGMNMLALLFVAGASEASTFSDIPPELGDALGISAENAALLLSCCILASLGMVMALLSKKFNMITVAIPMIAVMGFLVAISWLPYWILLIVGIIIATQFGMKIKETLT